MTRARIRNASQELQRWANGLRDADFLYGVTDCCSLVRRAISIMYGGELFPQIPRWADEAEAIRVWETWDLRDVLLDLGAEKLTLSFRRSGDILCWTPAERTGPWPGIAIALQTGQILATSPEDGVVIVPAYVIPETADVYRLPHALEVRD